MTRNDILASHLRRLTVQAAELTRFIPAGADEFVGLLLPPVDSPRHVELPVSDTGILQRSALEDIAEPLRPTLRWYTVRSHDPHNGTIAIDMVTHGTTHPGSRFATLATPGDVVGIATRGATWTPHYGQQLLIADATAAPALRGILTALSPAQRQACHCIVTAPAPGYLEPDCDRVGFLSTVYCPTALAPTAVVEELRRLGRLPVEYVWVSGEQKLATTVRRYVTTQWEIPKHSVTFCGYWRSVETR